MIIIVEIFYYCSKHYIFKPSVTFLIPPPLHSFPGCNCTKDSDDDEDQGIDDGGVGGSKKGEGNKNKSLRRAKRILRKSKRQKFARSLKRGKKRRQSKNKRSRSNRGRGQMMDDDDDDELRVTVFWFRKPIKRDAKGQRRGSGF